MASLLQYKRLIETTLTSDKERDTLCMAEELAGSWMQSSELCQLTLNIFKAYRE